MIHKNSGIHALMMRRTVILIMIIFSGIQLSNAQYYIKLLGYSVDTVYPKLRSASSFEKMHLYNQLAFYHSLSNVDSAMYYAEQAMYLAEKFDNLSEKGSALRNQGNAYALAGNYRQAVIHLQQALNIFNELNEPRKIAELYLDLGKLNYDLEDYENSLAYGEKLAGLIEAYEVEDNPIANPFEYAIILGMGGGAAREADQYSKAEKFFKDYIALSKKFNFPSEPGIIWIKSLGETFEMAGMLDSALKYTLLARSMMPQNAGKPAEEQTGYEGSIGSIYWEQGFPEKALPLIRIEYDNDLRSKSNYYAASSALNLGKIYLDMGMPDSALFWYEQGLTNGLRLFDQIHLETTDEAQQIVYTGYQAVLNINQAEVLQRYYRLMNNVYYRLYDFQKKAGNFEKALEYHEIRHRYRDSLNRVTNNLEERKTQVRYETERMEQELVMMEQENSIAQSRVRQTRMFLFGISGLLVAALFMVLLFLRQNRLKAEQDRIILQQKLFRSQMNPHFLYNSLASIQNFIVTEDPDSASIYLSRFSNLVRNILDSSNEEFVILEKEINLIENYLSLQKVRYTEKFDYKLEIDPVLDLENIEIPPMMAQPFIENAIEHGLKYKKEKGTLFVSFRKDASNLIIGVMDDGVGREKSRQIQHDLRPNHKSLATNITERRIAALNRKHRMNITMEIIDLKDDEENASGTKVVIKI